VPHGPDDELDATLRGLVEEFGLWFERNGLPRMAGRVVGWLLVCDPPEQTMQEIAAGLQASMGSISTMLRLLELGGSVERLNLPGERRARYRVLPNHWTKIWEDQLEKARNLENLVDRALAILEGAEPGRRERLQITRRYTSFFVEELPGFIERFNRMQFGADDA
jgi:DNA-binding transcriptional regulator GbsR (MarR family)